MSLHDWDGTSNHKWKAASDFDGSLNHQWQKALEFNGTTTYTVFQKSVTLTNLVLATDEKQSTWQDIGYAVIGPSPLRYFTAAANHQYYIRANLGCWAYFGASGAYAKAVIRLPPTYSNGGDILSRDANGTLNSTLVTGHWLVTGDGKAWNMQLYGVRSNTSQGSMWTSNCMIVDVTSIPSQYKVNADYVWGAIGAQFFRGSKTFTF